MDEGDRAMTDRRRPREQPGPRENAGPRENPGPRRAAQSERPASADSPSAGTSSAAQEAPEPDFERERRTRRARFLAELDEARELRKRVAPRRARAAELQARVLRTFRY